MTVDKESDLEKSFMEAFSRVDVLVTSGGVSMGSLDLVKPLLERLGTVHFGRLNMKPGRPPFLTQGSSHTPYITLYFLPKV